MADLKQQSICIKFCFILGKCASGTHEMPKTAFGDNLIQRTWTFEWFFFVQICRNFSWRLWALRSSLHRSHRWKCGEGMQNNHWRPMKCHFAMSERASLPEMSGVMVEPGLLCQCSNFWWLTTWLLAPIHVIWPLVISCFREWNCKHKSLVFRVSPEFRYSWCLSCVQFKKVSSSSDINAGPIT
jgi:hypothetical protein